MQYSGERNRTWVGTAPVKTKPLYQEIITRTPAGRFGVRVPSNVDRKRSINRILKYRRRKLEAERNGERVRRSRAKIGEIVPICRFSGQRQAEFCQQRGFELSTQQNYLQRERINKSTNKLDGSDRFGLEAEGLDSRCQGCRFHTKQFCCTSRSGNLAVCLGQSRKDTITLTRFSSESVKIVGAGLRVGATRSAEPRDVARRRRTKSKLNAPVWPKMTARSTTFCSSRTLPGQS